MIDGHNLRVDEPAEAMFCNVRNTRLLAVSDELVAAAQAAGVVWTLHDVIEHYPLERPHPYRLLDTAHASVSAKLDALSAWPELPNRVGHPLGSSARDANLENDPDEAWREICADIDDPDDIDDPALARYCSDLPLPKLGAHLDEKFAKSKLAKRWKDTLAGGFGKLDGLPCVSAGTRDLLVAAGVDATFMPLSIVDRTLDCSTEVYVIQPSVVVDWIDWPKSDIGLRWNGMMDEIFGLHPSEGSYAASTPMVRIAGTNLILVHESIAPSLAAVVGLRLLPLQDRRAARNLDDYVRFS